MRGAAGGDRPAVAGRQSHDGRDILRSCRPDDDRRLSIDDAAEVAAHRVEGLGVREHRSCDLRLKHAAKIRHGAMISAELAPLPTRPRVVAELGEPVCYDDCSASATCLLAAANTRPRVATVIVKALPLLLLALVAGVPVLAQSAARPAPDELARALQQKYDGVRDFSADFVHTYEGGILRQKATERGSVLIKKPGKMRWTYKAPEEKLFVSDGIKVYSYIRADNQVIVGSLPADDQATTPVLFLLGKGSLTRDFTVADAQLPDLAPDAYALKLTPKRREPEYEWLTLVVERDTLRLRRLIAADRQGGTSALTFSNLKENVGLSDTLFRFSIPRGAEVITSGRPSQ